VPTAFTQGGLFCILVDLSLVPTILVQSLPLFSIGTEVSIFCSSEDPGSGSDYCGDSGSSKFSGNILSLTDIIVSSLESGIVWIIS